MSAVALAAVSAAAGCGGSGGVAELACLFEQWYGAGRGDGWRITEDLGRSGIYGELLPAGLRSILDHAAGEPGALPVDAGDVFVDLGSGRGRSLLQVALTTPAQAIGIELSAERTQVAENALNQLARLRPDVARRVRIVNGDLRDASMHAVWGAATIVFINSACFVPRLMLALTDALSRNLQAGTLVYSARALPGCHRGLWSVGRTEAAFTWSRNVRLFVYIVAPRPQPTSWSHTYTVAGSCSAGAWLKPFDWRGHLFSEGNAYGEARPVGVSGAHSCERHAVSRWRTAPVAAARWCARAGMNTSARLTGTALAWSDVALWLRLWTDGGAAELDHGDTATPMLQRGHLSQTACAWQEFSSRQVAESRGKAIHARASKPNAATCVSVASLLGSLRDWGVQDESGATIFHHAAAARLPGALAALLSFSRTSSQLVKQVRSRGVGTIPSTHFSQECICDEAATEAAEKMARAAQAEASAGMDGVLGLRDDAGRTAVQTALDDHSVVLLLHAKASLDDRGDYSTNTLRAAADLCLEAGAVVDSYANCAHCPSVNRAQSTNESGRGIESSQQIFNFDQALFTVLLRAVGDSNASKGAIAAANASGKDGTAMHIAANRCPAALAMLLAARASPEGFSSGVSPLHVARTASAVTMLVGARADVQARNKEGATPLHDAASRRGGMVVVESLLSHRAEPSAADFEGLTPLMCAAEGSTASSLLKARAKVDQLDARGRSALHHAAIANRTSVLARLLAEPLVVTAFASTGFASSTPVDTLGSGVPDGADVVAAAVAGLTDGMRLKDYRGHTPIDVARARGHTAAAALLVDARHAVGL